MKVKVIVIAPNDGWAFIAKEEKIFLLRPPYISSNQIEVSKKTVENAIHLHGFEECDFTFSGMNELVRFLKEEYIKSKENQGINLPSSKQLKELLKYATDDVLLEYLSRAQRELIPEGKLDAAESIAVELMKLDRVRGNPEMLEQAIYILEKYRQEAERREKLTTEISNNIKKTWGTRFRWAAGRYSVASMIGHQKLVSTRRQLLPIGKGGV